MTQNYHTPHPESQIITDGGFNFNFPLGQLDQRITDMLAETLVLPDGLRIGAGTNVPSALLQMDSTTMGWGLPVLTTTQRDAITNPPQGLMIFNSTTGAVNFYNGVAWLALGSSSAGLRLIASATFTNQLATTISAIPGTYRDLYLRLSLYPVTNDVASQWFLQFNGDTASNYAYTEERDTATYTHSASDTKILLRGQNSKTSSAANIIMHAALNILQYAAAVPKYVLSRSGFVLSGAARAYTTHGGASWHKSGYPAITSMTFGINAGINSTGHYALYGRP